MKDESWRMKAACRGLPTNIFFPDFAIELKEPYRDAKSICEMCPVTEQCLALAESFATGGDRSGMFGGLTPSERRNRRKQNNGFVL